MNEPPYHRPVALEDGSALSIDKLVLDLTATRDWTDVEGALRLSLIHISAVFPSMQIDLNCDKFPMANSPFGMRWT